MQAGHREGTEEAGAAGGTSGGPAGALAAIDRSDVLIGLFGLAAYLAAAAWAREISIPGPALIWFPPAAVALALAYLRPKVQVPVVVVAEILSTSLIMEVGREYGALQLLVNAVLLSSAYALGGWTMRRLALSPDLRTAEDLGVLGIAAVVASTAATAGGIAVQLWVGVVDADEMASAAGIFWVGDVVAAVCLLPALVLVGSALVRGARPRWTDKTSAAARRRYPLEMAAPAVAAMVLLVVGQQPMRFVYLAFVPVVLVAVRHGIGGAVISNAILSAVLTAGAHLEISTALVRSDFQLLMLVLTLTSAVVGAVVSARFDVATAKARISEIVEATPDLVATATRDGHIQYLNPVGRRLLGFAPGQVDARAFDFLPDSLAEDLMREGMRAAERNGTWVGENRLRRPDGHVFPVSQVLVAHPHLGADGQAIYSTICRDQTQRHELEDQLRRAVLYDDATGLPNRALLLEHLGLAMGSDGVPRRHAVLFADVDHLDHVNETFGFAAGDLAVGAVAERLGDLVRGHDLVARHGGSQFVIVLTDVPDEFEAILLADRLLGSFAEPIDVGDGLEIRVTGSVGIALADGSQDPLEVLRSAEIALHRAKEAGGGRFALFDQALEARSVHRLELEADLHEVLTTQTWTLAYQPIYDLRSRRVVGAEALLRWTHPVRGPVPPFELIRLAEWSGSIVSLGQEIFRRACTEACTWHAEGFDLSVAINVSARQLREPGFVDDVAAVISETGIAPGKVVVELTETLLAGKEHGEVHALAGLRGLGCRVALDDFGTGYSSLSGLRDLPIDIVKLDQAFLTGLGTSDRAAAVVDAALRLAEALDLMVVAEGVEEDNQLEALERLGCPRVQGFALSRPIAPEAVLGLLRDARQDERS